MRRAVPFGRVARPGWAFSARSLDNVKCASTTGSGKSTPPEEAAAAAAAASSTAEKPTVFRAAEEVFSVETPSSSSSATTPPHRSEAAASPTIQGPQDSTEGLSSSSSLANAATANGDLVTAQRWETTDIRDERIVDEKGQYIVSNGKWPTGEIAYSTPAPPGHLEARFGYNVVQVKKPQTYWQYYRWNPHFSFRHLNVLVLYAVGLTFLCSFLMKEIQTLQYEMMKPGAMVGETRGKGKPAGKDTKIKFSDKENDDLYKKMQESYFKAEELAYRGNKDYQMKKIARPKEFTVRDYMRS